VAVVLLEHSGPRKEKKYHITQLELAGHFRDLIPTKAFKIVHKKHPSSLGCCCCCIIFEESGYPKFTCVVDL
jgi:hypothetical protein